MHVELIADVVVKVFFEVYRELRRWLKLTNDVVDHIRHFYRRHQQHLCGPYPSRLKTGLRGLRATGLGNASTLHRQTREGVDVNHAKENRSTNGLRDAVALLYPNLRLL